MTIKQVVKDIEDEIMKTVKMGNVNYAVKENFIYRLYPVENSDTSKYIILPIIEYHSGRRKCDFSKAYKKNELLEMFEKIFSVDSKEDCKVLLTKLIGEM